MSLFELKGGDIDFKNSVSWVNTIVPFFFEDGFMNKYKLYKIWNLFE